MRERGGREDGGLRTQAPWDEARMEIAINMLTLSQL